MAEIKRKLRCVMSVVLVFVMVFATGTPVQAQMSDDMFGRSVQAVADQAGEVIGDETELLEESESIQKQEDSKEVESSQKLEDSKESESTQNQEESIESECTQKQEESTESKSTEEEEETTEIGSSEEQEETTGTGSTEEEEETTEAESIERQDGESNSLEFNENSKYAIVAISTGLAMNITEIGWQNHTKVGVTYYEDGKKIADERALFTIRQVDSDDIAKEVIDNIQLEADEIIVRIECPIGETTYSLRTETANNYAFADSDLRDEGDQKKGQEIYVIKKTEENQGIIQAVSNKRYAMIDNGELRFAESTTKDEAEKFEFVKDPKILNSTISFEHKETKKYIKTYQDENIALTVDGAAGEEGTVFSKVVFGTNKGDTVDNLEFVTASLISKDYGNGIKSVNWNDRPDASEVITTNKVTGSDWESIRILANGDGTISFKDACHDRYITVKDNKLAGEQEEFPRETTSKDLSDNEKFIIHTELPPLAASDLDFDASSRTQFSVDLTWKNPTSLFTGIEVWKKKANESDDTYKKAVEVGSEESCTIEELEENTEYKFKIRAVLKNGSGDLLTSEFSDEIKIKTRSGVKPATPQNIRIDEDGENFKITWDAVENATEYRVFRAPSLFGTYEKDTDVKKEDGTDEIATEVIVTPKGKNRYENYYRVIAIQDDEESDESDAVSLETEMFGDHTIIFAETDVTEKIDEFLQNLFDKQNDYNEDAQFKGEQWQIYFKPGDYTETSCMYLGFYTSFNGLGKTPYDVKLNNIAIPAYLPAGALGGQGDNATCNFWRSAENLAIINTGNDKGKAGYGSYRPNHFNWAVAQAAPLRRVYSERPIAYDWNYGWASGGYVADCLITGAGVNEDGSIDENGAGTWSGQQFFTRNSEITYNTYGTTLNNFFMGVEAANNLSETNETGYKLRSGQGYTNWGISGPLNEVGLGDQQVVTEITNTPKISEKPFLYLDDDGEYKVFVPAVRENVSGISWGKNNMGNGESLSLLKDFYIANPDDTAAKINEEIASGKNIYFTPGIYHAEKPIVVDRENTILLGTGMASIIPDNSEMAMYVGDKDGIRIEGLIFDAGLSSKLLLQVGDEGIHTNHSKNPIILQDLFFRVGGTTDVLTKANDALEINSDDVIGDHFWIWRADHGAGVEWYGNESKHGLIVNGDNVTCYALFNEHFQEYHTLWNGENGATYFYQNETCYDPISQDAWMSHNGTVKGYSSYKVSNDVEKHYAVGLGIYNVFIYTGPSYDASGIGIQLDNAIEVPNKEGVLVENACTQTFANDQNENGEWYPLSRINHIVNGIGGSVSSGEGGEGWSRKYVLYYQNGEAEFGKETNPDTFYVYDPDETDENVIAEKKARDERNRNIGTDKVTVEAPADETIYLDRIVKLYNQFSDADEGDYTEISWKNASMDEALANAKIQIDEGKKAAEQGGYSQSEISALQTQINKACSDLEAASERLVYIGEIQWLYEKYKDYAETNYTAESWIVFAEAREQLKAVLDEAYGADYPMKTQIYALQMRINNACETLEGAAEGLVSITPIIVTGVTLNKESVTLRQGNIVALRVSIIPSYATNQKVTWSSSDPAIAEVDENGKVTTKKRGTAVITVTTDDGGFEAQCEVNVTSAEIAKGVTLDQESLVLQVGESGTLVATVTLGNVANKNVIWSSSNSKIAEVDKHGTVTAVREGKTVITVMTEEGGYTAECNVTVGDGTEKIPITGVSLPETLTLEEGQRETLVMAIMPENANISKKVEWSSSDPTVATVDENGNVTAIDGGIAEIKVMITTADGTFTATCTVTVKKIPDGLWIEFLDGGSYEYTGTAIKPQVCVHDGKKTLIEKKDYTISYKNNTKANYDSSKLNKQPMVVVKGKGIYSGTETKTFTIFKPDITKPADGGENAFRADDLVIAYTKKAQKPVPALWWNGKSLKNKSDYTIAYYSDEAKTQEVKSVKDTGEYTIEITGKGNFTGTRDIKLTVDSEHKLISSVSIPKIGVQTYTGQPIEPITIRNLDKDKDYIVTYSNNIEIGTAYAVIEGRGDYIGSKRVTFQITGPSLSKVAVVGNIDPITYGDPMPEVSLFLKNGGTPLESENYTVSWSNNLDAGNATVVFTGKGGYTGTLKKNFKIKPYNITQDEQKRFEVVMAEEKDNEVQVPYAKGGAKPKLTVNFKNADDKWQLLEEGTDYTVTYKNNVSVGKQATLTIKGKGNFTSTQTRMYDVIPQDIKELRLIVADKAYQNKKNNYVTTVMIFDVDDKQLKAGKDYDIKYYYDDGDEDNGNDIAIEKNENVPEDTKIKVVVTGKEAYADSETEASYTLKNRVDISKAKIVINPQEYTGEPIIFDKEGKVLDINVFKQVKIGNEIINDNERFDEVFEIVCYQNNIKRGTASVVIKGKGEYGGVKTVKFKITSKKFWWWDRL